MTLKILSQKRPAFLIPRKDSTYGKSNNSYMWLHFWRMLCRKDLCPLYRIIKSNEFRLLIEHLHIFFMQLSQWHASHFSKKKTILSCIDLQPLDIVGSIFHQHRVSHCSLSGGNRHLVRFLPHTSTNRLQRYYWLYDLFSTWNMHSFPSFGLLAGRKRKLLHHVCVFN